MLSKQNSFISFSNTFKKDSMNALPQPPQCLPTGQDNSKAYHSNILPLRLVDSKTTANNNLEPQSKFRNGHTVPSVLNHSLASSDDNEDDHLELTSLLTNITTAPSSTFSIASSRESNQNSTWKGYSKESILRNINVYFTAEQIELLQWSWSENHQYITPTFSRLGDCFDESEAIKVESVSSLMKQAPFWERVLHNVSVLSIFSSNSEAILLLPPISHLKSTFASIIRLIIFNLKDLSQIKDYLFKLGRMHERMFNATIDIYDILGDALNKTLAEHYKTTYTEKLEMLWITIYQFISSCMLAACIPDISPFSSEESLKVVLTYTDSFNLTSSQKSAYQQKKSRELKHAYSNSVRGKILLVKKLYL